MIGTVLAAGLICWLVTHIIVEGVVFDWLRDWIDDHAPRKIQQLIHCELCTGTWVGFILAALIPGPIAPLWILNGFLYKAVGHLILELWAILYGVNAILAHRVREQARSAPTRGARSNGARSPIGVV